MNAPVKFKLISFTILAGASAYAHYQLAKLDRTIADGEKRMAAQSRKLHAIQPDE